MAVDPLYEPLGTRPAAAKPARRTTGLAAAVVAVVVLGGIAAVLIAHRQRPDESVAVASIEPAAPDIAKPAVPPPPVPATRSDPGVAGVTVEPNGDTVEFQHGVKIIRLGPASTSGTTVLKIPDASTGAGALPAAPDPRLVEASRWGDLPRTGPDGARAAEVYARPAPTLPPGTPRLAILLTGLGPDPEASRAAAGLPPDVSLGFGPLGRDLGAQVADARSAGHEVLLQLLAPATREAPPAPADRFKWLLGRFSGYAGLSIVPGTDLPPDAAAPLLRDIAARGLFLVDDAAGDATVAAAAGRALQTVPADIVLDASADAGVVAAALDRLTARARAEGHAFGVLARSAAAVDALALLTRQLPSRGVTLVPVSALVTRPVVADGAAAAQ